MFRVSDALRSQYRNAQLRGGDLIMTVVGAGTGQVEVAPAWLDGALLSRSTARIAVDPDMANAGYVRACLQSPLCQKQVRGQIKEGAQPVVSCRDVGEFLIPFPPLAEQRAIAAALGDVDALLAGQDKLIAKKRDLKQAAMQQLLTGKTRLPGFNDRWAPTALGDLGVFSKGKGIRKHEVQTDGLACVRYGEIYTHHNDYVRRFYSFVTPEVAAQSTRMQTGDLLFAGSGETVEEIGKCVAFLGADEAYAGGDIVIFHPENQDSMFLGYLLNHSTVVAQKSRMGQGDAVVHISARNLARLKLWVPSLKEQRDIAAVLADMDAELETLERRRDKTALIKQGMMQELLTGRTRLV